MTRVIPLLLSVMAVPLLAQDPDSDLLRSLTKLLPELPANRVELKASPPLSFEGISAVTTDKQGNVYVIHRPMDGDPVVVLNPQGKVLRSWGKGMFKIPHGIRIDPAGNVWTVDANTSMVYKFSSQGQKLLEISVGDVPDPSRDFCGATDVAFAQNGRVFVTDGYCNARVIGTTLLAGKFASGVAGARGQVSSTSFMQSRSALKGISMSRIVRTADCSGLTSMENSLASGSLAANSTMWHSTRPVKCTSARIRRVCRWMMNLAS